MTSGMIYSQSSKGDITLAPQIGLNISSEAITNASSESRTAFAGGVIGEYYFSDRWSFRTGLLYDPMGGKGAGVTDKLNYLTLPLNANWHFGKTRAWYLNFGAGVSFLLSAKTEVAASNIEDASPGTYDIKEWVNSTDVGLILGIGYKFDLSENFQLYIDYQGFSGMIDIVNDEELENYLGESPTNVRSAFNLGLIFTL